MPEYPPRLRAGKRTGSVPGVYKYTKFRSQLEIRFATELDARQIRWFYEPERLGEGRYLVDFYLPDCKSWVEVKGKVNSRDHLQLREVADLMQRERRHRLFMYMQDKAFAVTLDGFCPLSHDVLWQALANPIAPTN